MIVLAHAGHVLVDLLYALPLFIMVGLLLVGKLREKRARGRRHGLSSIRWFGRARLGYLAACDDHGTAPRRALHDLERGPRGGEPGLPGLVRRAGRDAYAVYRAAEDRADAAEQALAAVGAPVLVA